MSIVRPFWNIKNFCLEMVGVKMFCHKEIIERLEKMKKEINLSIDCAIGFIKGIDIVRSTPFDIKALIDDEDIIVLPNAKTKSHGKSTE